MIYDWQGIELAKKKKKKKKNNIDKNKQQDWIENDII